MSQPSTARTVGLVAVDALVLLALRPDVAALGHGLAAPRRWVAEAGADAVVVRLASCALWLVAARVAVGLVAALAARLPGAAGRLAASVAAVALPAVLRRVVAGSAGLGLLLAPAVAQARTVPAPSPVRVTTAGAASGTTPGPSWPAASPGPEMPPASATPTAPGPAWPSGSTPHTPAPRTDPTPPHTPAPHTPPPHTPAPHTPAPHTPAHPSGRVTVHAGDCLWLLAAHRLGPTATDAELARYVPHLYAANRAVVGTDPDLVVPGQVLEVPSPDRSSD